MFRTIEWTEAGVVMLDQRRLPEQETYLTLRSPAELAEAIRAMAIRGAPAIGVGGGPGGARGGPGGGGGAGGGGGGVGRGGGGGGGGGGGRKEGGGLRRRDAPLPAGGAPDRL